MRGVSEHRAHLGLQGAVVEEASVLIAPFMVHENLAWSALGLVNSSVCSFLLFCRVSGASLSIAARKEARWDESRDATDIPDFLWHDRPFCCRFRRYITPKNRLMSRWIH